jgi:hypothetical protein
MKSRVVFLVSFIFLGIVIASCGESEESRREREQEEIAYAAYLVEQREQARREEEERLRLEAYRTCINNALIQYVETIQENNIAYSPGRYAAAFEGISLMGCPSDFSVAFNNHISVCKQAQQIANAREILNSEENTGRVVVESLWSTITGAETTPFMDAVKSDIELKRLSEEVQEKLQSTFGVIERVARQYGVE